MYTVLFVDDEIELQELVQIEFELSAHELTCASSGNQAYELFSKNKFDIIITDEHMPNGSGLELITKLRSSEVTIPIIISLSDIEFEKREKAEAFKNIFFIEKPYNISLLTQKVEEILG